MTVRRDVKTHRANAPHVGRRLDKLAREAIERCAWVAARCGYSPREAARWFQRACEQIPRTIIAHGGGTSERTDLAAHVLTLWRQERGFVSPNGDPRPLPLRGRSASVEALVRRVGRGLTLEQAEQYLRSTRSLRRVGARYVPRVLHVAHPARSRSQQAHHMRVFVDFLRTLDHNTSVRRDLDRWFQYSADNRQVPLRLMAQFAEHLRKAGRAFLNDKDILMYRLAADGQRNEPSRGVSVGIYLSQGPLRQPSIRKTKRSVKRRSPR